MNSPPQNHKIEYAMHKLQPYLSFLELFLPTGYGIISLMLDIALPWNNFITHMISEGANIPSWLSIPALKLIERDLRRAIKLRLPRRLNAATQSRFIVITNSKVSGSITFHTRTSQDDVANIESISQKMNSKSVRVSEWFNGLDALEYPILIDADYFQNSQLKLQMRNITPNVYNLLQLNEIQQLITSNIVIDGLFASGQELFSNVVIKPKDRWIKHVYSKIRVKTAPTPIALDATPHFEGCVYDLRYIDTNSIKPFKNMRLFDQLRRFSVSFISDATYPNFGTLISTHHVAINTHVWKSLAQDLDFQIQYLDQIHSVDPSWYKVIESKKPDVTILEFNGNAQINFEYNKLNDKRMILWNGLEYDVRDQPEIITGRTLAYDHEDALSFITTAFGVTPLSAELVCGHTMFLNGLPAGLVCAQSKSESTIWFEDLSSILPQDCAPRRIRQSYGQIWLPFDWASPIELSSNPLNVEAFDAWKKLGYYGIPLHPGTIPINQDILEQVDLALIKVDRRSPPPYAMNIERTLSTHLQKRPKLFKIRCVGKKGVGKSNLIDVIRTKPNIFTVDSDDYGKAVTLRMAGHSLNDIVQTMIKHRTIDYTDNLLQSYFDLQAHKITSDALGNAFVNLRAVEHQFMTEMSRVLTDTMKGELLSLRDFETEITQQLIEQDQYRTVIFFSHTYLETAWGIPTSICFNLTSLFHSTTAVISRSKNKFGTHDTDQISSQALLARFYQMKDTPREVYSVGTMGRLLDLLDG